MQTHIRSKLGAALAIATVMAVPGQARAATNPKPGTACTKAKLNTTSGPVVCTKVGKKYLWKATPPPTTAPTGSASSSAPANDPALKAALETAIGGAITYNGTCGFLYGCNAKVHFPDADPAVPSLLSIGGMPPEVFQNQLVGRQLVPLENAGFKAWSDDKRAVYFMPTRPIDKNTTHYEVRLTVSSGVPNGSPVFANRNERLLAAAKVFESFVSKSAS
jgi:hypothetical protein